MMCMIKNKAKLTPLVALVALMLVAGLVLAASVQAASFDCAKAVMKVEKLICADAELSKLDEELSVAYKTALQDKKQADTIKQAQKQWMSVRNDCSEAICVKRAYEMRLKALASTGTTQARLSVSDALLNQEKLDQKVKFKEADKNEIVKRIMAKLKFKHLESTFCEGFLNDFTRMENIEFVEPVERAAKFDNSIWAPFRARCPNMGLYEKYSCEPRIGMYLETLPKEERDEEIKVACSHYQCTENFKHFRLNLKGEEGNRTDDIFYCERMHGPLNIQGVEQHDSDGGYVITDLKKCEGISGPKTHDPYSYVLQQPLANVNGLVIYKGKHYIFDLREIDVKTRSSEKTSYELEVWSYDRRGSEKRTRLYSSCLFTTAASIGNNPK